MLLDYIREQNTDEIIITPNQLHKTLCDYAKTLNVSTRQKEYPKSAVHLSRQINRLIEQFGIIGIEIEYVKGKNREWHIRTKKELTFSDILEECRKWIMTNKDNNGLVFEQKFRVFLDEIDASKHTEELIKKLFDEALLSDAPETSGAWRVLH